MLIIVVLLVISYPAY
ncbi:hypothetical protein [Escherichia coli]|nr:hypothetical protein [Escherichia coli]